MISYQDYWISEEALSDKFCDDLILLSNNSVSEDALTEDKVVDDAIRKSKLSWIDDADLSDIFFKCMLLANQEAGWNFDITGCEVMQFSTYYEGNHYGWHIDTLEREIVPERVRKLSLVVSLNDDYEGGEFQFSWGKPSKSYNKRIIDVLELKKRGSIIVFPSYLWHRVKHVTLNEKHSIALWAYGPSFR